MSSDWPSTSATSSTSASPSPSPLPRGLVNRQGTPIRSTQRLPSLRGDPMASPPTTMLSSLSGGGASSQATTKGGVTKRVFKPTIPTRRSASSTPTSSQEPNEAKGSREGRGRGRGRGNRREKGVNKGLIQLESSVFSGVNASEGRKTGFIRSGASYRGAGTSRETNVIGRVVREDGSGLGVGLESKDGVKREGDERKLEMLYRDDFVDDAAEEPQQKPRGWENVCPDYRSEAKSKVLPFDDWLRPEEGGGESGGEKLLLFQVPDLLVNRPEGKIGKLRVYKSGRIEFIDADSGLAFDILETTSFPGVTVKSEDQSVAKSANQSSASNVSQEVVSLSGNSLISLGRLNNRGLLVAVPRLPDKLELNCSQ